jgi:hypothetical protein
VGQILTDHNVLVATICTRRKKIVRFHKRKPRWDLDQKGPYILQSEVEKAIKEMRDKKATGYTWGCTEIVGRRWSKANDTADQQHVCNWRMAQRFY